MMKLRRYLFAVAVTAVITLVVDVLLNAIIFRNVFESAARFLRPHDELNALVPLGWVSLVVIVAAFGLVFVRGSWEGLRGGLEFGGLFAVASVAGLGGLVSFVPWPLMLVTVISVQQMVNALVLGLVFGWFYRSGRREASGRM
jgi:hypothetical protein